MVELLDGRKTAKVLNKHTSNTIQKLAQKNITPGLAVVIVGNDAASERYVRMKEKKANSLGIYSVKKHLPEDVSEDQLLDVIDKLNKNSKIDGILVQMPLPKQINSQHVIEAIDPLKDVDGFHPLNIGKLFANVKEKFPVACTPKGIMTLLHEYNVKIEGMRAVVIGRSDIVGKPMFALLNNENATVTLLHSHTKNLKTYTKNADIVVSAVGKSNLLADSDFKNGAYVIDAGQNLNEDGKLVGDINDDDLKNIKYITPVPGGVGPMTIATLMQQTTEMCEWRHNNES